MSPGDQSNGIEESPKRRQSVRFQRNQPFTDPPSLETTRLLPVLKTRYLFFCSLDLRLLTKFPFNPSREIIQHEWNKIARKAGAAEIEFVNQIDEEELPPGIGTLFPYVERKYIFDVGMAESRTLLAGCRCRGTKGCAKAQQCSCQSNLEGPPAYTPQGLFAFNTDSEIIECNTACECGPKCINRVAQLPRRIPVQIFKTEKRGWGARIPVDVVRGRVVGLYTGLLIRREEADKLSGSRASYCFDLDVNEEPDEAPPENAYSVDAYGCGNWTRFINHSCSPNLQIISVVYDTMPEDNMPYLALVATKHIPAFTELTFDYNPAHQTEWELKRYREKTRSKKNKSKKQTRCLCGTSQCRGWLSVVA
ncbi:SET domain-containing protein [Mycena olivaceomarginata]|nr:SET domain-containing protein [Mycena olivaceomarginata]